MKSRNRQAQNLRNRKGQALIETAVAAIFLVPIVLGLLDVTVMVVCNSMNDSIAKNAARAAANQPDKQSAKNAAENVFAHVAHSCIVASVSMKDINYTDTKDAVTVSSKMEVTLPVAIAGLGHQVFVAQSVQQIVSE